MEKTLREEIYNLPRIKTCAKCIYWQTCPRTDSTNFGKDNKDFPEMLCKAEADSILSLLSQRIKAKALNPLEQSKLIIKLGYDPSWISTQEICRAVSAAQLQAVLGELE
jgi:hypothetical protein